MSAEDRQGSFAALLRRLRRERGWTQEELAERAGMSSDAVSSLERGARRRPWPDTIERLSRALQLSECERDDLTAAAHAPGGGTASPSVPANVIPWSVRRAQRGSPSTVSVLPTAATSFVGRVRERAEVFELLCFPQIRLLSLVGPGGVGKTRLALEVARDVRGSFRDGVAFIPLAEISEAALVYPAVIQVLGLQEAAGRGPEELLTGYLRRRQMLLVMDNLEHLTEVGVPLARLVQACPQLTLLSTSRAPLRVSAEHVYDVAPLLVPQLPVHTADALLAYDAARLLMERARAVNGSLRVPAEQASIVAQLCRRLDGLPLAIELAAARMSVLTPQALLDRLGSGPDALGEGMRDAPARHRTLEATMDWSYALLSEGERALVARLAVFAGGCWLDAIDAVANFDALAGADTVSTLTNLVGHSLVRLGMDPDGQPRYTMLETIRQYALERLEERIELSDLRARHAVYYCRLAMDGDSGPGGHAAWLSRLEAEHPNLRAAMRRLLDTGQVTEACRTAVSLFSLWLDHSHTAEAAAWFAELLSRREEVSAADRAALLLGAGWFTPDEIEAIAGLEESLGLYRTLEDTRGVAMAAIRLADAVKRFDHPRAMSLAEEGLALMRSRDDIWGTVQALQVLAPLDEGAGEMRRARERLEEALPLCRQLGHDGTTAWTLYLLAVSAFYDGGYEASYRWGQEALALERRVGNRFVCGLITRTLALAVMELGDLDRADALVREGFSMIYELSGRWASLEAVASVAARQGQLERAATIWGAVAGLREAGAWVPDDAYYARQLADAEGTYGGDAWSAAWNEGKTMTVEEAAAYAVTGRNGIGPDRATTG